MSKQKNILDGQSINLRARQTVYALAALIDKANPSSEIVVNADDLLRFINNTPGEKWSNIYEPINQIFIHLNQHPLKIESTDNQDFVRVNWLGHLEVKAGQIHAQFTPRVIEYFMRNQGLPHAQLLEDLRPYKSKFTAKIIRLFQKHSKGKNSEIEFAFKHDLNELKHYFQVEEKYLRFFDFERFVLLIAQKELEENDILPFWFSFEKIKQGRNIKDISFTVYVRPKVLLDLRPQLRATQIGETGQRDIFDEQRAGIFDAEQQQIFEKLTKEYNIGKAFAQKTLLNLTLGQAKAYERLIEFGINKTTAFSLLKKYCNRKEIAEKEEAYINSLIKEVREKEEHSKGSSTRTSLLEKELRSNYEL